MTTLPARWRGFRDDQRGITLVEFALISPVLMLLLVGAFDMAHTLYMRAVLQGVVQKAARDATLESGGLAANQTALNERVTHDVQDLNSTATVAITRRYYKTFSAASAARHEEFTDSAVPSPFRDGICNNNEPFVDANNNGVFDADGADNGQGGAKDAVVYTVTVSYPRLTPLNKLVRAPDNVTLKATTVFGNQPYGPQSTYGTAGTGHCNP